MLDVKCDVWFSGSVVVKHQSSKDFTMKTQNHTLNAPLCILSVGVIGQFGSDKPYRMPHTSTAHRQTTKTEKKKNVRENGARCWYTHSHEHIQIHTYTHTRTHTRIHTTICSISMSRIDSPWYLRNSNIDSKFKTIQ